MPKRRTGERVSTALARSISAAIVLATCWSATPSFADSLSPLTIERPAPQSMVLTQGFSTTIHSERPFGRVSITDPDIVDLVLRTDKTAVLVPQRLGRTNIDFLDDTGNLISRMNVTVVRQTTTDRVVIYNRPSLGAYSAFHCGRNGCERFEEVPDKEQAMTPGLPQDRGPGMPQIGGPPQ